MMIQPGFGPAGAFSSTQQQTKAGASDFHSRFMARAAASQQSSAGDPLESKKSEILSKFPGLTEEKLEDLIKQYDIERMDEEALYELAQQMMAEGVVPNRPQENGLNMIAVYPKALYDAFLNGETFMNKGVVREGFHSCFTVNPASGSLDYQYPKYGLKNLEYNLWMTQNSGQSFNAYYTEEERSMQLQLTESKTSFWELAKLLSAYRQQAGRGALGIRS
ncbi:MAG: hypothetical protein HFE76_00185 [Firmicutes bacterium]|nr:hypothetical protein [Bacillota bacterium]